MRLRYFGRIAPRIGTEITIIFGEICGNVSAKYEVISWKEYPNEYENLEVELKIKEIDGNALDTNAQRTKENE